MRGKGEVWRPRRGEDRGGNKRRTFPNSAKALTTFVFVRVQGGSVPSIHAEDTDFSVFVDRCTPSPATRISANVRPTIFLITDCGARILLRWVSDASATVTRAAGNILKITIKSVAAGE